MIFFLNFFEHVFVTNGKRADDFLYLLLAMLIIVPLSMINNFALFSKASFVGNLLIVVTLIIVTMKNFDIMYTQDGYQRNSQNKFNFSYFPMCIGVSIYAFEAVGIIMSIRSSIEDPINEFPHIFKATSLLVCVIYLLFAVIGVLANGD